MSRWLVPRGRAGRAAPVGAAAGVAFGLVLGASPARTQPARPPRTGARTDTTRTDTTPVDSTRRPRVLEPVVVTASRRAQRTSDAPVTTEVISRAEVARSGAQDLHALVTQYVGVQPEPSVAGSGGVQIEGLSSARVLVLIDGQPLAGRVDGELDLSRVPAWLIDRVEIVKGPLATLYGSAAMGGVINVITRRADTARPAVTLAALGGTQGRLDASGTVRGGVGALRGWIGGGRREDEVQPGRPDQSGARANRWDATGKLHWAPASARVSADASVLGVREDQRWRSGQLFYFADNTQTDARLGVSMAPAPGRDDRLGATLTLSRFAHLSRQATLPEPVSAAGDRSVESLLRAELTYSAPVRGGQVLDAGVALNRAALTSGRITTGRRRSTSVEPYAQYALQLGRLAVVPGARVSVSDEWGTHLTPKVATLLRLAGGLAVRASAAAGYRAPDFKERYLTFLNSAVGYVVHGNPNLAPETSANVTAGLEWTGRRAYARVQGYSNRLTGFIESVALPDSGAVQQFTYANVARGSTRGVDADAGLRVGAWSFDGSVAYLHSADRATGLPLLGTTPHSARLTASGVLPGALRPTLTLLAWGRAPAAEVTAGGATTVRYRGAFTRVDARLARSLAPGVDAQLGATNLFGATPTAWPGTTARRVYAGASLERGF